MSDLTLDTCDLISLSVLDHDLTRIDKTIAGDLSVLTLSEPVVTARIYASYIYRSAICRDSEITGTYMHRDTSLTSCDCIGNVTRATAVIDLPAAAEHLLEMVSVVTSVNVSCLITTVGVAVTPYYESLEFCLLRSECSSHVHRIHVCQVSLSCSEGTLRLASELMLVSTYCNDRILDFSRIYTEMNLMSLVETKCNRSSKPRNDSLVCTLELRIWLSVLVKLHNKFTNKRSRACKDNLLHHILLIFGIAVCE